MPSVPWAAFFTLMCELLLIPAQPLLIENQNNGQFYFIDVKGRPLPWRLPYDEIKPFSNGMAVVTQDNKSGAIDTTGTLRVPLKFGIINPFQTNLASAEMDGVDGLVLINKTGVVVKKLGSPTEYTLPTNGNDATYSIRRGENTIIVYDADGKQIDQQEQE